MISPSILVRCLVWLLVLLATVWVGRKEGSGASAISRLPEVTDVPYRDWNGRGPRLDLYLPTSKQSPETGFPAVLLVHGGSWIGGSKSGCREDPSRSALRLTEHGIAVIAVDYLLGRPWRPSWPVALYDLRAAVFWTRINASKYRIDSDRIAVLGQSAGAHLAMLLGMERDQMGSDGTSRNVQAVISLYGPTDIEALANARRSQRDPIFTLLGHSPPDWRGDLEREASPILQVGRSAPPMLLFHGSDDRWVPPDQARAMARALGTAGVPHRLVIVDGARHGFETIVESPRRIDLLPEILAFLDGVWNLSGETPARRPTPSRASIDDPQRAASGRDSQSRREEIAPKSSRAPLVPARP